MHTTDNPDVVVEACGSLLCPGGHCPHHGPGLLLPLLCPHSYTTQLPPLNPLEATISLVHGGDTNHYPLIKGICAHAQPLLVEQLNLSSQIIQAVVGN